MLQPIRNMWLCWVSHLGMTLAEKHERHHVSKLWQADPADTPPFQLAF